ncbi:dTMP kinase [Catalinimonas alkaloidigena]|uniref:dTMP kinase n=1 Tax=Catalinimonas alkaloidigena TaxID=1075417 RepID=UPI0024052947|nr:dTMP kinase [Catalinimonas alkaloidigena]MDF9798157.1 dTMP kinase [Catalinimonas alkaloidigena]
MTKNVMIALEGIDGSGKSTQIKLLAEHLEKAGHKVYTTFEPTDSPIGKMIRDIFSHRMEADHKVIAGLFVADRLNHLLSKTDGILKKLEEGYTVLTDRYYLSSYAYHSVHMEMDWVIQANAMSAELLRPALNIFIDISPEISMERINKGRDTTEMYETLDNLQLVRNKYYEAFEKVKGEEKISIIDGNRSPEAVATDVWKEVSRLLADR